MPQVQFNLSKDGHEIALMAIAFNVSRMAAAKALGEVNAEAKAARDQPEDSDGPDAVDTIKSSLSIDRFSEHANDVQAAADKDDNTEELGFDRKVSFVEWCVLLAAVNDELDKLGKPTKNGGTWPRAQKIEDTVAWLSKVDPTKPRPVRDDDIAGIQAMAEAHSGQVLPLEDARKLAGDEAMNKAVFFAGLYTKYAADINDRVNAGILNYNRFSETSFETLFNNLPVKTKHNLLGTIDFKLSDKCDELLTGKTRGGKASPTAAIPALAKASTIALIRGDQKLIKRDRQLLSLQLEAEAA